MHVVCEPRSGILGFHHHRVIVDHLHGSDVISGIDKFRHVGIAQALESEFHVGGVEVVAVVVFNAFSQVEFPAVEVGVLPLLRQGRHQLALITLALEQAVDDLAVTFPERYPDARPLKARLATFRAERASLFAAGPTRDDPALLQKEIDALNEHFERLQRDVLLPPEGGLGVYAEPLRCGRPRVLAGACETVPGNQRLDGSGAGEPVHPRSMGAGWMQGGYGGQMGAPAEAEGVAGRDLRDELQPHGDEGRGGEQAVRDRERGLRGWVV